MAKCLDSDADRLDAVFSLPHERIVKSGFGRKVELDVSSRHKEYEPSLFPLNLVFDMAGFSEWKMGYQSYFNYSPDNIRFLSRFEQEVWMRFQQYKVPVIELLKDTPKEAVCQVFEKVNTGGVTLSVFELLTATLAADDFQLHKDWQERKIRIHQYRPLQGLDATDFLTAVTLLTSYKRNLRGQGPVGLKRRDVLNLSLKEYRANADAIEKGMIDAARLLIREKIFDTRTLPYRTQVIPLSAICPMLGPRFEEEAVKQKLIQWYWCGVFGELYGGSTETRFPNDIQDALAWIGGAEVPRSVRDATFDPLRFLSLQSRLSAAYKGIIALLIQKGRRDFRNGDPLELTTYFDLAVDIQHVFP